MDFEDAIAKHCDWKVKFRSAMLRKEKMDVKCMEDGSCCELGQWLIGQGHVIYGYLSSFQLCLEAHTHFHYEAGKIARLVNEGNFPEAEAMMGIYSNFDKASRDVTVSIIKLRDEAQVK